MPPAISGLHHLKLPVSDLARSRAWYETVLGPHIEHEFTDDDGVVRGVAGTLSNSAGQLVMNLALRQNPQVSAGMNGFDPLSLSLADHADLHQWADHVASLGYQRPQPTNAILALHDPDGHEIRLFSPER